MGLPESVIAMEIKKAIRQSIRQLEAIKVPKKNLILPFSSSAWTLNSFTTNKIIKPYRVEMVYPNTTTYNHYVSVDVKPNTDYTLQVNHNGNIAVFNETASIAIVNYTSGQARSFNSGSRNKIKIYFRSLATTGLYFMENPQLEEGTTATPFEVYQSLEKKPYTIKGVRV